MGREERYLIVAFIIAAVLVASVLIVGPIVAVAAGVNVAAKTVVIIHMILAVISGIYLLIAALLSLLNRR